MTCDGCGELLELTDTCNGWLCAECLRVAEEEIEAFRNERREEAREHARKDFEGEVGADSLGER